MDAHGPPRSSTTPVKCAAGHPLRELAPRGRRGREVITEAMRAAARRSVSLPGPALLAECEETFFVASGPGGQHRNKTESGVRLVHGPTGLTITATERRSQAQNRAAALERLRERLAALAHRPKVRRATKPSRGARERRLREKKHVSGKKAARKGGDE